LRALIYSNLFISLGAVLLAHQTVWQANLEPLSLPAAVFVFGGTVSVYLVDRLGETSPEDDVTETERDRWYRQHESSLWAVVASAVLAAGWGFLSLAPSVQVAVALFSVIPLLYVLPFFNIFAGQVSRLRLKKIPGGKVAAIALSWTLLTVCMPFFLSDEWFSRELVYTAVQRFSFIYAVTIPFEIKDLAEDREAGVRTVASLMGPESVRWLSLIFLFVFAGLVAVHHSSALATKAMPLWLSGITTSYLVWTHESSRSEMYYFFGLDGMLILQPCLVAAGLSIGQLV
jgi:4-hydroxybenzoate polyprenyltransferase